MSRPHGSGAGVFPGWEFYAPVAGADRTIFSLLPDARVILDEPEALGQELDKVWARIEEAHERGEIGNLVRPEDLYLAPDAWRETVKVIPGADLEYLAIARSTPIPDETVIASRQEVREANCPRSRRTSP